MHAEEAAPRLKKLQRVAWDRKNTFGAICCRQPIRYAEPWVEAFFPLRPVPVT